MKYYAVIDTNVLVSAALKWKSIPGSIHGKTCIVWRCISWLDPASAVTVCTNRTIKEEWLKDLTEFDEHMVRKLIRQITIYQDRAMIEFKSGITIDIEA